MTNTKFRKRALLSSVAMLLVALVALGSATFAWFTANPNAYAQGVKMRTTAAAGLVVRTDTDDVWSHEAKLRKTDDGSSYFNLQPVTQDQITPDTFYKIEAANSSNYGAKSGQNLGSATAGTDYYTEKIYCQLSPGSNVTENASKKVYLKGVTINAASGASMQNAIRVSIKGASGSIIGTYCLTGSAPNGVLKPTGAADMTPASGSFTPAVSAVATNLNVDTGLTGLQVDGSLNKYITVYCWLDGQDTLCTSDNVGTNNAEKIIESVKIDLTLAD